MGLPRRKECKSAGIQGALYIPHFDRGPAFHQHESLIGFLRVRFESETTRIAREEFCCAGLAICSQVHTLRAGGGVRIVGPFGIMRIHDHCVAGRGLRSSGDAKKKQREC